MKKATLFLVALALVAVIIMTGCSKTETPTPTQQPAPATAAAPQPEPPKVETVTLTSKTPFFLYSSYQSGSLESIDGPDSEPKEGLFQEVRPRDQFSTVQYATLIPGGNTSPATISKFVRIPMNTFSDPDIKALNLDDPKLETLPPTGWKIGTRITVYVFRSEFGSRRSVLVGNSENAKERTLDELQRDPYFWQILRNSAGQLFAEPDERGMLTSFAPEGITAFLTYLQKESPHKNSLEAIKRGGDEYYSGGYQAVYLAGKYRYLWAAFNKLPQPAQLVLIDQLGPPLARLAIDQVGPDIIRRYVTDLMWDRISRIDPKKDPDNLSWWPHQDENAVVAYYGLSKKQYRDLAPVMLFWARRGQPVFERVKAVFARELVRTPPARR